MTRSLVLASSLAAVSVLFLNDRPIRGTEITTNRLMVIQAAA